MDTALQRQASNVLDLLSPVHKVFGVTAMFGDGTPVPSDGSLAHHDAANNKTYLLNDDGSVSPLGADGPAGQPISPAGFRRTDNGQFAPVDPAGQQLAPLLGHPPRAPNGYHDQTVEGRLRWRATIHRRRPASNAVRIRARSRSIQSVRRRGAGPR